MQVDGRPLDDAVVDRALAKFPGLTPWSDDSPPVALYAVNETRRPTNGLVILAAGTGNDTAALASAR